MQSPELTIKAVILALSGIELDGLHRGPKALFGLSIPISAVQFEKNGRIWNSHVGFDYKHSKQFACAIELRDDLFVWKNSYLGSGQQASEPFPVGTDARGVLLTNAGQFLVGINVSFDMLASGENRGRAFQYCSLFFNRLTSSIRW